MSQLSGAFHSTPIFNPTPRSRKEWEEATWATNGGR
jgi:hypothetical protein